jgi:two-component sensor histidine kinase
MKIARPGRQPLFRDLRSRILVLMLVIVAPIFVLALIWAMNRDLELRRFQFHAAEAATLLVSERLERLTQEAGDIAAGALPEDCALPPEPLAHHPGFEAGLVIRTDQAACDGIAAETQDGLRARLSHGEIPALLVDADGRLLIAEPVDGGTSRMLVLRVAPALLDRILRPDETPFLGGVALMTPERLLIERHQPDAPPNWWPGTLPSGAVARSHSLASAGGGGFDYLLAPITAHSPVRVVGLQTQPFLGTDQWRLWTTLGQAVAVLLALLLGAIWAVNQSALRWITYLRRIATAHSRGHHSVRAKVTTAPSELAELGRSLNHMANDAARRAALLRETAEEKSALLLELHHRVKNNFQVITSLLSLHRQDMPEERREEIRFVEDYVRAMAVAYRVAYDSGDVTGVRMQDLMRSVVSALRESTEAPPHRIDLGLDVEPIWIDLDRAISIGLYLAAILPPYLKALGDHPKAMLAITATRRQDMLRLSVGGLEPCDADRPPLRAKLLKAYLRQLKAAPVAAGNPHEVAIVVPLDEPQQAHRLASLKPEAELPPTARVVAAERSMTLDEIHEREQRLNLLMREMAHRSKNILAVTEAIARQSLAQADSLEDFGKRFSARLHSLAQSHDLLTQVEWSGTQLHALLRSQLGHYIDGGNQIVIEGPEFGLAPVAVPYLGLALHELSTNAAKHGALSIPEGRVSIRWGTTTDPEKGERFWLRWIETAGPPVVVPTRRGFGTDVTRKLVSRAVRGTVSFEFAETGIIWHLDAPAANLVERPSTQITAQPAEEAVT